MDANTITTLISTLGFPIFCVVALGFFIYKSYETITNRSKEREEKLYSTILTCQEELKEASKTNASFIEILQQMRQELTLIHEDIDKLKAGD
jgi:prefoldin subunit 5